MLSVSVQVQWRQNFTVSVSAAVSSYVLPVSFLGAISSVGTECFRDLDSKILALLDAAIEILVLYLVSIPQQLQGRHNRPGLIFMQAI